MAMPQPADLPMADFYLFLDCRDDMEQLQNQYDPGHPSEQSEDSTRVIRDRAEFVETIDPSITKKNYTCVLPSLYAQAHVPLPPHLVNTATSFSSRLPARLQHFERVKSVIEAHLTIPDWYMVVSPVWRAAVEGLEPGVHEFFPHSLNFHDGSSKDHFVFRTRTRIDRGVVPNVTPIPVFHEDHYKLRRLQWMGLGGNDIDVRVGAALLSGNHWIRCDGMQCLHVASRPLAKRLLPLLPPACYLIPMKNVT